MLMGAVFRCGMEYFQLSGKRSLRILVGLKQEHQMLAV
jgi:hypothetical protein